MGRTACTEPQWLYKGALYFTFPTGCPYRYVAFDVLRLGAGRRQLNLQYKKE